jgi:hypothetical protein
MLHRLGTITLALTGCDADGGETGMKSSEVAGTTNSVPGFLQEMLGARLPTDGSVQRKRTGTFRIEPDTWFCTYSPGFSVDKLGEALEAIGQDAYLNGAPRTNGIIGEPTSPYCAPGASRNPIYVRSAQVTQIDGKTYRIALAVWQGDPASGGASWVGAIERVEGGPRPTISNPFGTDRLPLEISADMAALSKAFIEDVVS